MSQTHCRRGHELTGANVRIQPSSGKRQCKACVRRKRTDRHPRETLLAVPNEPLRERFLVMRQRGELTAMTVAVKLGWYACISKGSGRSKDKRGDTVRVLRTLGLSTNGDGTVRERVGYESAVELAHALGMDPHEAGV